MNALTFKTGGALTADDAAVYIEREADQTVQSVHLRAMDYALIIEPRQQGKTSLVNRLMHQMSLDAVSFAYVDITTLDTSSEMAWYQTLCPRLLRQLRSLIPEEAQWPAVPQNSAGWREFLSQMAGFATGANRRIVMALDEIGAMTFSGATAFFSVLRDIYNSRQAERELKQLTFLLVGAFHPRDLIKDDKVSPFNIAQRVRLPDFTGAQVRELVGKGEWSEAQADTLAERIYYWTDGQPYLTQLLCAYLKPDASAGDVDAQVERLRREDENHLPPLLERLHSDQRLREYIGKIQAGQRIKFYPRENRRQAQLELLGLLKANQQGYCVIRNRIYQQLFQEEMTPLTQAELFDREMLIEARDSLRLQLQQYYRNLFRLEEQRAKFSLNVPLEILSTIDDTQANIERVETRLQQVMAELERLST